MTPIPLTIRSSSSRRRFRVSNKQYNIHKYNIIMQQMYLDPKDRCVSRSVCPTSRESRYVALLCDALASTTRRMTRGPSYIAILYCEASRSTCEASRSATCVKTHAHTCRRARNSKDPHIIRKASRMRYADAASHASPHYILPPLFLCVPAQKAERNKTTKDLPTCGDSEHYLRATRLPCCQTPADRCVSGSPPYRNKNKYHS